MTINTASLLRKLASVRNRIRLLSLGHSSFMFLLVAGGLVIASFTLDWLFQLPHGARAMMLLLMAGVMAWGAYRFFLAPFKVPLRDDDIALLVESRHPELGDHLISALQLARQMEDDGNTESRELMESAVAGAVERFKGASFLDSVSARPMARPALYALGAAMLLVGYAAARPDHASLWIDRCLLLEDREWPPRTRLDVRIANIASFRHEIDDDGVDAVYVPENSVLRVEVRADGELPPAVYIKKFAYPRAENPVPITIEMPGRPGSDEFEYKFGRVTSSFEFFVEGGDDDDERPYFRVFVRAAPRIDELAVDYDYPDYINETGREDRLGVKEYNVVGPVGTHVVMSFRTSARVSDFALVLDEDEEKVVELTADPGDERLFRWSFTLENDHFYTYRLVGTNGAPSRAAPNFNISAQPDLPPQIGILMPETGSIDVTPIATMPLEFQVIDDYRVGTIEYRWDTQRDGAFANRVQVPAADLREDGDGREVEAFAALEMREMTVVEDGAERPLHPGDNIYVRLIASDTRSTDRYPEPNESSYPTLLVLHVREAVEIERELMRSQVRLKDQVVRVELAVATRIEELGGLISAFGHDGRSADDTDDLHGLVAGQALVTSSLSEAARSFVRIFDGYLFNRMDATALTETLVAALCNLHRTDDGTHYEFIGQVLPRVRAEIDDSETMGKLTRIMDLLQTTSEKSSPEVDKAVRACVDLGSASEIVAGLQEALRREQKLHAEVLLLIDKMEEWEDFQDVIQSLKDIIELEKGLWDRMKQVAK